MRNVLKIPIMEGITNVQKEGSSFILISPPIVHMVNQSLYIFIRGFLIT